MKNEEQFKMNTELRSKFQILERKHLELIAGELAQAHSDHVKAVEANETLKLQMEQKIKI